MCGFGGIPAPLRKRNWKVLQPAGRKAALHRLTPPNRDFLRAAFRLTCRMNVIRHTDANFPQKLRELTLPGSLFDSEIEQRTRAIIDAVRLYGDAAVLELTEKFDGAKLSAGQLAVTQAE